MTTTLTNDQITAGAAVLHELKTDPAVFAAVLSGAKTHEIRANDRGFAVGDILLLRETVSTGEAMRAGALLEYTGREITRTVSHVLTGYGLQDGWCILSLTPSPQIAEKVELLPLPVLQDAAQAINRLLGAVEGLSYVDSAREFGERTLTNILRITEAAPASAGQAGQVAAHMEPVGRVKDRFAGTDKAYRTVIWADRTFAMDVPDGAYLYAAPITERAAAPASGDISQSAPMASAIQGEKAAATSAGELPAEWQQVMDEVARATRKFPTWPTDPLHAVAVLGEEFGELTKAVLQTTYEPHKVQPGELRTEAIQTAAMSLRFLASLGRYEFAPSPQHNQDATHQPSAQKGGA